MRHFPRKLCERLVFVTLAVADAGFAQDSEITFDVSEYERKPFEFRGYAELSPEYTDLNQDGALYKLQFFDEEERDSIESLEESWNWREVFVRVLAPSPFGPTRMASGSTVA